MGVSSYRFRTARDRGCAYLLGQLRPEGGFGPPERGLADYYKVPAALLACGASAEASRLLHWIRRHGMTAGGDFGPRPAEAVGYYSIYYNAWVILGAHRQQQFDLSQKGMDFVARFRDHESGGFYSTVTDSGPHIRQDLWVTAGAGQAALVTGRGEVALGVGRWMKRLMELQPDYPSRLYSVYSRAEGLITQYDPGEEVRFVLHASATRDEYFFHPGIAAGFLASLYLATGDAQWLELARTYMRLPEIASDFLFGTLRAGKVGWAAAVLFRLTGEPAYQEMAIRVGDALIGQQSADGAWTPGMMSANDATAEMVVWLDEIHQAAALPAA